MKLLLYVIGAVFVLVGCLWILQGVGVLPGRVMGGHIEWAIYGGLAAAIGIAVLFWAYRRGRA
jgi:hypothetical protein